MLSLSVALQGLSREASTAVVAPVVVCDDAEPQGTTSALILIRSLT